ncbi:Tripeptidyl aminopeptidase [Streptomyces sp. enrichment culture]|uniref:alpha/beta fold hydrolase n=1 Tax=Streptomyces sp. enrichment culture TaxID=1795815 RepID=UPI003F560398
MPTPQPTEELGAFLSQPLRWSPSDTEEGLELASVEVPLDYADPGGRRISIAVSRRPAADPARRRGVLLSVHGGPGGDNGHGRMMPVELHRTTPLNEVYDLIGFDPRGTGASTRLDGEDTPARAVFDSRPPDSAFALLTEDMRAREEGCRRAGGELRRHVSTRNTARDMDLLRAVLGEERISFVGYAYGTLVGAVYGTMFPARLDRSVLDSSVHPGWDWRRQFMAQALAVRENVDAWAAWAGERNSRYGLGTDAAQVLASVEETASLLAARTPDASLRTSFDGIMGTLAPLRPRWDVLALLVGDLHKAAASGSTEQARELLAGQSAWRPGSAAGQVREAVLEAVTCETDWPADLEVYYRDMRRFREECPYGYGVLRAQPWVGTFRSFTPAEEATQVRREGYPAGLVVQADGDPLDHHEGATAMAERLEHRLVLVTDSGAHEIYGFGGNALVDEHVNRYLLEGVLPGGTVRCPGEPRPDVPADADADTV